MTGAFSVLLLCCSGEDQVSHEGSHLLSMKDRSVSRGAAADGEVRTRWSSLRRLTLERLIPARRAWSGEELRATESEVMPLPLPRGGQPRPFLPHYESTGSSCLLPGNTELHQSSPSVFSPVPRNGKRRRRRTARCSRHLFISSSCHCLAIREKKS